MSRHKLFTSASAAFLVIASTAISQAQDGPLRRTGRALDNAGKNVRARVEGEVVRGQISAQERDLLARVTTRIRWDKKLVDSLLQIEVQPDGTVILRGSVLDAAAKNRAVDLAESTVGVTKVVDELAINKEVRVIEASPARPVKVITTTPTVVVPVETKVVVPADPTPVVKP